jgi:hypothetical protein
MQSQTRPSAAASYSQSLAFGERPIIKFSLRQAVRFKDESRLDTPIPLQTRLDG